MNGALFRTNLVATGVILRDRIVRRFSAAEAA